MVQKRIIWHQSHLSVIYVWVLFSGTMMHSFSSEAATKARKGTQEKTRLSRFVLANKPSRNTPKYSSTDRADPKNLDHSGLNLKVKFLGGDSNTLIDRVTDKLSCLATQFADDKLAAMRFLREVTSDIGV